MKFIRLNAQRLNGLVDRAHQLNVLVGNKLESDAFRSHAAVFLVTNFPRRVFIQVGEVCVRVNYGVVFCHVRGRALVEKGAVNRSSTNKPDLLGSFILN